MNSSVEQMGEISAGEASDPIFAFLSPETLWEGSGGMASVREVLGDPPGQLSVNPSKIYPLTRCAMLFTNEHRFVSGETRLNHDYLDVQNVDSTE